MKFLVKFGLNGLSGSMYDNYNPGKGLDIVQAVRENMKRPKFPMEKVAQGTCHMTNGNFGLHLGDEQKEVISAAKCYFQVGDEVLVTIPSGWLGQFMKLNLRVVYRRFDNDQGTTGIQHVPGILLSRLTFVKKFRGIYRVYTEYEVDQVELLEQWVAAKCPKFWGITEERHTQVLKQQDDVVKREHIEAANRYQAEEEAAYKKDQEQIAANTAMSKAEEVKKLQKLGAEMSGLMVTIKETLALAEAPNND